MVSNGLKEGQDEDTGGKESKEKTFGQGLCFTFSNFI